MDYLAKFAERLNFLIEDEGKTVREVAVAVKVHRTTVGKYLKGKIFPATPTLIAVADYFMVSVDYLVGKSENMSAKKFKKCPPFGARLDELLKLAGVSKYALSREAEIPESIIYEWRDGKYYPSVPNLIKTAEFLDCTIDYLLGRE